MKITIILHSYLQETSFKDRYLSLYRQVEKITSAQFIINILIVQNNIKDSVKEHSPEVISQFNQVKNINNEFSQNENTTYLLVKKNMDSNLLGIYGIDYAFEHFQCDYFIWVDDNCSISDNFLCYYIFSFKYCVSDNNFLVTAESIFFRDKKKVNTSSEIITEAKKLIQEYNLECFFTRFNYFPDTNFGTNLRGWQIIKEIRESVHPYIISRCKSVFLEKKYYSIMPVVPRSRHLIPKRNHKIKNTYLLSEYTRTFFSKLKLDKTWLYEKTVV